MNFFEFLEQTPVAFYLVTGTLGLMVGSFLNVVIHRLPTMLERDWTRQCRDLLHLGNGEEREVYNLVRPRSHCPACKHKISVLENIPVFSYLVLKGRCSSCANRISPRYPVIESLTCLLTVLVCWQFDYGFHALFAMLFTWALLALSVIDFDHQLLPDDITLPFLWIGILLNMYGVFTDVYSSLYGVIAGYGVLWTVYIVFKVLTGKEGMGHGDFKLLAMLGAWTGWQMLPLIILLSSMLGACVGLTLILMKKLDRTRPIPFGPFLAFAGWIALLWGDDIMSTYLQWSRIP